MGKVLNLHELESYVPGEGCKCYARSKVECACPNVDWTDKEVYILRAKLEWQIKETKELNEEIQQANARIAELEEALEPDLFWPADDTEISFDSIDELFDYYIDQSSGVGMRITAERAAKLTNATYELIKIDDDYCSFEVAEVKDE